MSAEDCLNDCQFALHVSPHKLSPGTDVVPAGKPSNFGIENEEHSYFTNDLPTAFRYQDTITRQSHTKANIYKVAYPEHFEADPRDPNGDPEAPTSWRTKHPLRVLGEL